MVSIDDFLPLGVDYPGIDINVELMILQEYLHHIPGAVSFLSDQYLLREIRKLDEAPLDDNAYLEVIAKDEMPKLIRLPLCVSIYAMFEYSIKRLLDFAATRENCELFFADINGRDLFDKTSKYMSRVLGYDFSFDQHSMRQIKGLATLRNHLAHGTGDLSVLPKKRKEKILELGNL